LYEKPLRDKAFFMTPLVDGVYEVLVVDAQEVDRIGAIGLELVITAGAHKGEVVRVRATNLDTDALSLLAIPGQLTVDGGVPSFEPG
jgi:hypothetical protein